MTATPREPHVPPYQGEVEPRITLREYLDARLEGHRREVAIEFEGRDRALEELKSTTKEWKATQNEWNTAVRGVGVDTASKAHAYTDQKFEQARELVDARFGALEETRRNDIRTLYGAIAVSTAIIGTLIAFLR